MGVSLSKSNHIYTWICTIITCLLLYILTSSLLPPCSYVISLSLYQFCRHSNPSKNVESGARGCIEPPHTFTPPSYNTCDQCIAAQHVKIFHSVICIRVPQVLCIMQRACSWLAIRYISMMFPSCVMYDWVQCSSHNVLHNLCLSPMHYIL